MCQLHLSGFYFARSATLKPDDHERTLNITKEPPIWAALYVWRRFIALKWRGSDPQYFKALKPLYYITTIIIRLYAQDSGCAEEFLVKFFKHFVCVAVLDTED